MYFFFSHCLLYVSKSLSCHNKVMALIASVHLLFDIEVKCMIDIVNVYSCTYINVNSTPGDPVIV